jgi:hypothetical protein
MFLLNFNEELIKKKKKACDAYCTAENNANNRTLTCDATAFH